MSSFDKTPILKTQEEEKLINPIIDIRTDICPICRAQAIELYSYNSYPQNYNQAVDAYLMGYKVKFNYEIRYMRCKSCNKLFTIDWSRGFPKPLKDSYITDRFFKEFLSGN